MPSPPYSPTKQQDEIKVKLRLTLSPKLKKERKSKAARDQDDELYYKTFGLKLSVAEADIQRGIPSEEDKEKFEKALLLPEKVNGWGTFLWGFIDLFFLMFRLYPLNKSFQRFQRFHLEII